MIISQIKQLSVKYGKLRSFSLKRKEIENGKEKRWI